MASNFGCKVYNGYMYYVSSDGTRKMSINDSSINTLISNEYKMYDLTVTSNGQIFAKVINTNDKRILVDDYYILTNIYGQNIEILNYTIKQ